VVEGIDLLPVAGFRGLVDALAGEASRSFSLPPRPPPASRRLRTIGFSDVRGEDGAKRAMGIAVAGGHNALMLGPPGSGKPGLLDQPFQGDRFLRTRATACRTRPPGPKGTRLRLQSRPKPAGICRSEEQGKEGMSLPRGVAGAQQAAPSQGLVFWTHRVRPSCQGHAQGRPRLKFEKPCAWPQES
jgi:hypothetical protein